MNFFSFFFLSNLDLMWYIGTMKKLVLFAFILSLPIFLTGCTLPWQKAKRGALQISSSPKSTVFLDDKHVGQTPYYDEKLKPGEYVVKLMPETEKNVGSYTTKVNLAEETLTVINREFGATEEESAGEILSLEFLGKNKSPELAVLTDEDQASIKVDGDFKGTSPLVISDIKEGDHEVEVSLSGFASREIKIKIVKNYRLIVNADLKKETGSKSTKKTTPTPKPTSKVTEEPEEEIATESSTPETKKFEAGQTVTINDTETGWLRVRMEPSLSASEAAKVNPGEEFEVLDEQAGWVKIEYEDGQEGWVSGDYLTIK